MAGEWNDAEDKPWADALQERCEAIESEVSAFHFVSVRGFDKYQGPVATVTYLDRHYKVWFSGEEDSDMLWIEGFPIDNTSGPDKLAGFQGDTHQIITLLRGIDTLFRQRPS